MNIYFSHLMPVPGCCLYGLDALANAINLGFNALGGIAAFEQKLGAAATTTSVANYKLDNKIIIKDIVKNYP
jgi:hypothetical protein